MGVWDRTISPMQYIIAWVVTKVWQHNRQKYTVEGRIQRKNPDEKNAGRTATSWLTAIAQMGIEPWTCDGMKLCRGWQKQTFDKRKHIVFHDPFMSVLKTDYDGIRHISKDNQYARTLYISSHLSTGVRWCRLLFVVAPKRQVPNNLKHHKTRERSLAKQCESGPSSHEGHRASKCQPRVARYFTMSVKAFQNYVQNLEQVNAQDTKTKKTIVGI